MLLLPLQFDTLPMRVGSVAELEPGDLIFYSGAPFDTSARRYPFQMTHVEVFVGGETGEATIGVCARCLSGPASAGCRGAQDCPVPSHSCTAVSAGFLFLPIAPLRAHHCLDCGFIRLHRTQCLHHCHSRLDAPSLQWSAQCLIASLGTYANCSSSPMLHATSR